jgi:CRISPR-associated protein Csc3
MTDPLNLNLFDFIPQEEGIFKPEEAPRRYAQMDLLQGAVDPADTVLAEYVEVVGPYLLEEFSLLTAKGGTGDYDYLEDQSMLSHILNGVFPTLRIVRWARRPLSPDEERLYLAAYTLHDLDKLCQVRHLSVADFEHEAQFYSFLEDWMTRLALDQFLGNWSDKRGDLAYLILNTHKVWGANLNFPSFDLTLPTRRLGELREMCTFSDKIAYLVKQPSDIVEQEALRESLLSLGGGQFDFAYHQLAENKGLLTNVLNNALLGLLQNELGWRPLLFFPTGVVYLRERAERGRPLPTREDLAQRVEERLTKTCKDRLVRNLNGFTRDGKGFKFPDYYRTFFGVSDLLRTIASGAVKIIREGKDPSAGKRCEKLRQIQAEDNTLAGRDFDFADDLRVDLLAEFLDQVEVELGRVPEVGSERAASKVLELLDLTDLRDDFAAVPRDTRAGGVPLHWYFAAGKYLARHPGLDAGQMRALLDDIAARASDAFSSEIAQYDARRSGFAALRDYVQQVVDINGGLPLQRDFAAELERYEAQKRLGRGAQVGCSLCSSPFATVEQMETDVVFNPQVYTGKRPLGSSKLKRGICELCQIEMMLRQILLRSRFTLVGGGYEDVKIKWFYLYPAYFFTTETARFAGQVYQRLKHLNYFDVRKALREGMEPRHFLGLDELTLETTPRAPEEDPILKMEFDEHELATFFFGGLPTLGKKPTDTESWAIPTFLGLLLPLAFNAKVVVTESIVPLYAHGAEWKETTVLDAPHGFVHHLLHRERFRLDELLPALRTVASAYDLNIDAHQDKTDPRWTRLAEVARNLDTDPFYVFHYLRGWQRQKENRERYGDQLPSGLAARYLQIYEYLGGENMSLIAGIGERCFRFYGPKGFVSNAILRLVALTEDVLINSPPETCPEDLQLQIRGEIGNVMERLRNDPRATGFALLHPQEEPEAIRDFVDFFYREVFLNYCQGERALLRARRNRFNAGVEAWYHENWRRLRDERQQAKEDPNVQSDVS